MTAYEVIALADELAPNVFSNTIKLFELNRLEQRIRVDILKQDPAEVTPFTAEDLTAPASVLGSLESGRIDDPTPGGGGGDGEITDPTNPPITGEGDDPGTGGDSGGSGSGSDDSGSGSDDSGSGTEGGTGESGSGSDDSGDTGSGSGGSGNESGDETPAGTLALEERYRDVYVCWMVAMYYWHMGEYEEYQNKKAMFDAAWTRFERDVCIALDRAGGYA